MEKEKLPKLEDLWISLPEKDAHKFSDELAEVNDIFWELIKNEMSLLS